ncbi:hypothetical protein BOTNAR_3249g00010 [Botryotinia narcissicola]|uniref:Uncharacterized protein n=1 Tax=Botryotinia narcissicola TaxID=278944 RepID=A0A4Z1HEU3_9HELO|nr:hypothetical protein BOTNAR_3249g00010 [Botryotinia narcissicola]
MSWKESEFSHAGALSYFGFELATEDQGMSRQEYNGKTTRWMRVEKHHLSNVAAVDYEGLNVIFRGRKEE